MILVEPTWWEKVESSYKPIEDEAYVCDEQIPS